MRRVRYAVLATSVTLVGSGGLATVGVRAAAADVAPGQGSSYAQALQVTPHEGSLAVGAVLGEALAGHTNGYARAQSQGLDLGAVGTSLKGYNCGEPPNPIVAGAVPDPLIVETGQPGAAAGVSRNDPAKTYGATEQGLATATPYAEAMTTFQPVDGALFQTAGAVSTAWSGIVNGQREAGAQSDIGSVSLVAGAVVLQGLHWSVIYPSTGDAKPSGSFGIAHATIAGQDVPTASLQALATAANKVLGAIGMQLDLPEVSITDGRASVTPLELRVVPNANRDTVVDAILNGIAPVTNPVKTGLESGFGSFEPDQLRQALCKSNTPITVADVTIASISGAGFFNAAFGGVNAASGTLEANPYSLSLGSPGTQPGSVPALPGGTDLPGGPAALGDLGVGTTPGAGLPAASPGIAGEGATPNRPALAQPAAATGFDDGGPLLALGLGGLAAVALLAEADRRVIARTKRRATFED